MNLDMVFKMIYFNAVLSDDFKVKERSYFTIFSQEKKKKETKKLDKNTQPEHPSESNHLDVFSYVLEVVFAVLHGHLVVVLALRDVSHLGLGFVLQQKDGRRHQHTQNHLETKIHTHVGGCCYVCLQSPLNYKHTRTHTYESKVLYWPSIVASH